MVWYGWVDIGVSHHHFITQASNTISGGQKTHEGTLVSTAVMWLT